MPVPQFIFFSCDEFQSAETKEVKFIFNDSNFKKVLKYLEENMTDYFYGNPQRIRDQFKEVYKMVKEEGVEISKAINSYKGILAYCEEVDSITNIQH